MTPLATPQWRRLLVALVLASFIAPAVQAAYTNFETVPVRPLALSRDGRSLFAVNTPDGQLEIFDITREGLKHRTSVSVGLEPVAVAARSRSEVWVVNHLSDSVSIVDVASEPPRVVRTLLVGDEPWDVVFGGERSHFWAPFPRAFISAARRGQNHPENTLDDMKTEGLGRADVWVFDANDLGTSIGGTPLTIVRLFGDKPRPLAVSRDGATVYAGVFHSGNQTTSINPGAVCDGGADRGQCVITLTRADDPPVAGEPGTGDPPILPGGLPAPNVDSVGDVGPEVGLIVRFNEEAGEWQDGLGRNWNGAVPFDLPDLDVFAIDAKADVPVEIGSFPTVGTTLFNMTLDRRGRLYVSNTEAPNEVRFEGSGNGTTTVRGHLSESRITIIDPQAGSVTPRHLNKHIDYLAMPQPPGSKERSLATPHAMAFSRNGRNLFVAAFGSQKIGILRTRDLRDDSFVPSASGHVELSDGGPAGLVLDPRRRRLYVYTRFSNAISIVDTRRRMEIDSVPLHNPEPQVVRNGRKFLYDANLSSSNGEASCSSCHVHGDKDDLAWDLGNPDGQTVPNLNPFFVGKAVDFHPLKGPMLTQTFRGMANKGPMHWRGDRSGALLPGGDPMDSFDETTNFLQFNGAFGSLIGRDEGNLSDESMLAFADFALTIFPPPNPNRPLDNIDVGTAAEGRRTFLEVTTNPQPNKGKCNLCHRLSPAQGFFGTAGLSVPDPKSLKIPHLRNVYDKVGAFGLVALNPPGNTGSVLGDQVRGFGMSHTGSVGDVTTFLTQAGFNFPDGQPQRLATADFLLTFPSNLAPIVGQQITLGPDSGADVEERIDLMIDQALTFWIVTGNEGPFACDLTVKGVVDGEARGFFFDVFSREFLSDRESEGLVTDAALRAIARVPGQQLNYTCVPPGSGPRLGIDRDDDGSLDGDERDLGTDPNDAGSVVGACSDGLDNDGDGLTDSSDPECLKADHFSESQAPEVNGCDDPPWRSWRWRANGHWDHDECRPRIPRRLKGLRASFSSWGQQAGLWRGASRR